MFHAAMLTGRVAPVPRRALSFFVSHGACLLCPSNADGGDEDLGERLPVTALLRPPFLLLAEVEDLLVLRLGDDLSLDGGARDGGRAHLRLAIAADEQDLERQLAAQVTVELLDLHAVALRHAILLSAGPDHRVHRLLLLSEILWSSSRLAVSREHA